MKNEKTTPICEVEIVDQKKVTAARKKLANVEQISEIAGIFKLLGEPTRLKIVLAIMNSELCVCDLAASMETNVSTVSHQLRLLRNARIAKFRKDGKMVFYSLDDEHINTIVNEALNHYKEHR